MKRKLLRYLRAIRTDLLLLMLVICIIVIISLPQFFHWATGISQDALLVTLVLIVTIALFYYLRFMMILLVLALVVGANLPAQLAARIGISQTVLLATLGALVIVSLINQLFKLMPTGLDDRHVTGTSAALRVLNTAVRRGDVAMVSRLVGMGVDVNLVSEGVTPLMVAAEHGYTDLVEMLLHHGANPAIRNPQGHTAGDIARLKGYSRIALILRLESPPPAATRA